MGKNNSGLVTSFSWQSGSLTGRKPWIWFLEPHKRVYTCSSHIQEEGGSEVQGHPQIHTGFEDHIGSCLKHKQTNKPRENCWALVSSVDIHELPTAYVSEEK